mgnify:CR=1 FL=1
MTYTLDQFCADAHDAMEKDSGNAGRNAIRGHLEKLLINQDFVTEHLASQGPGKTLLYHDKDFDFYVMGPIRGTARASHMTTEHHGQSMDKPSASPI